MKRSTFLRTSLLSIISMDSLKDLKKFSDALPEDGVKMPVLFIGHGSPMNGIEDNIFSQRWKQLGKEIPQPRAVLVVSAHWFTRGTFITAMDRPQTIHDFGGFPKALFDVQYPAPGDPALAAETAKMITKADVILDHDWGLDHGAWTIIKHMYPAADIPVLQLSIDYTRKPSFHYELAKELAALRTKGVLIVGSGNMVHNLRIMNWNSPESGFDWAIEMNDKFKKLITSGDHASLIDYEQLGQAAKLSIPTPEHYLPLLYTLGLQEKSDEVNIFNDKTLLGSISMTSVKLS
ncbi:MAG TPA: 4,5-DOPA dioxygenase extradiol [Chryseolinea sp.]|nr:4,5-DOPA dioxygenase extradiol [Chryseolinea sp.]